MLNCSSFVSQAAERQQNQLPESEHLPGPAEPQPAVAVRQQAADHQQRPVRPSALHQDSVSVVNKTHLWPGAESIQRRRKTGLTLTCTDGVFDPLSASSVGSVDQNDPSVGAVLGNRKTQSEGEVFTGGSRWSYRRSQSSHSQQVQTEGEKKSRTKTTTGMGLGEARISAKVHVVFPDNEWKYWQLKKVRINSLICLFIWISTRSK